MSRADSPHGGPKVSIEEWTARESICFSPSSPDSAVDRLIGSIGRPVDLLAFGEPFHPLPAGDEFLLLRNRLFERLVNAHGFRAIAVESSFPRGRLVDDFINGKVAASFDDMRDAGFSHGFGKLDANRALIEWMRRYNADDSHATKLRFYGFDSPTEMMLTDSPRQLLQFALDYLASIDPNRTVAFQRRVAPLLDQDWENTGASFDHTKSVGLSLASIALRIEIEDLITELRVRQPELVLKSDADRFAEAVHYASHARQMLNYHAGLARSSPNRIADLLGLRDLMMAENLAYIVQRERSRGKVFAFAHNSHLQRGIAKWQLGENALSWWPAGAHLHQMLGTSYAMIGSAVGTSAANGIAAPEAGTLEAYLAAAPGPARFIPICGAPTLANLPLRSGSSMNPTYFPLTPQCANNFDFLAVLG